MKTSVTVSNVLMFGSPAPTGKADQPLAAEPDQASRRQGDAAEAIAELQRLPTGSPGWARLRERIIVSQSELVRTVALRFSRRGLELDDLVQVANVGLIKALDRFDPARRVSFAQFAVPTMTGEIKRHFRDHAWTMHVHRSLKEMHLAVFRAESELSQRLQRTPTASDIAAEMQVQVDQVYAAAGCAVAYQPRSLNAAVQTVGGSATLGDQVGGPDHELDMVTDRLVLREALAELGDRDRQILRWRFVDGLTQAQIGRRLGVSQMHISRLLSAAFAKLRALMLAEA